MASFSNVSQQNVLKLIYQAIPWTSIADNTATSPATVLYLSLHNADPGEAGSQITNETNYTNYARVAVTRSAGGFSVAGSSPAIVSNAGAVNFPQCGVTGDTLTHFGIGLGASGATTLLASGPTGAGPALEFTATAATPGVLIVPGSGFLVNDRVSVYPTATGTLPSGFVEGTVYYIGTAAGISVTLSSVAANGAPVNTSSVGSGVIIKQTPLIVSQNITPSFAASALQVKLY